MDAKKILQAAADHCGAGQWKEAAELCEKVLRYQPSHVGAMQMLAAAQSNPGEFEEAASAKRRCNSFSGRLPCNRILSLRMPAPGLCCASWGGWTKPKRIIERPLAWRRIGQSCI